MKKSWLLIVILIHFTASVIAQPPPKRGGFQHGIGANLSLYSISEDSDPLFGLSLRTKYNLINNWSDFSGSFNAGLSTLYHPKSDIDSNSFFAFDAPVSLELNIGHLATKNFRNFFGFFAGAGFSFSYINKQYKDAPILTTGFRTWLFSQSITFRYIHYLSQEDDYALQHGFSIILNLGAYLDAVKANNKISDFMRPFPKYPQ
ncbi:MAG: hypothetical protein ACR2GN_04510 [Bacteroidia bacterium]